MNELHGAGEKIARLPYLRPELISIGSNQADGGKGLTLPSEGFTPTLGTQPGNPS